MTMTPNSSEPPATSLIEESPLELLLLVARARKWLVTIPLTLCLLFGIRTLLADRSYTTSLYFIPQAQSNPVAGFAGLAAQLGINVGGGGSGVSPDFYIELVRSYQFLQRLAMTEYTAQRDGKTVTGTIASLYEIDLGDSARTADAATRLIAGLTNASVDPKSEVIKINITTFDPDLSVQVGRRIVELVNEFNSDARRSKAAAERVFVEGRMNEAKSELRVSENEVLAFMQRNRDFRNSPQLTFENDRLQRELLRRQGVFNSLAQAYEQARIDEVRNTPVVTVVQEPIRPARPDSRRLVVKVIVAGVFGVILAILLAFGLEGWERLLASDPVPAAQLRVAVQAVRQEARHPIRTLRSWFARGPSQGG